MKNKGITLIALVITIIVLLILAGVTIAMLTGDEGILNQAVKAEDENSKATEEEQIRLSYNSAKLDSKGKAVEEEKLQEELRGYDSGATVEKTTEGFKITFTSGKSYTLKEDGTIEKLDDPTEGTSVTAEEINEHIGQVVEEYTEESGKVDDWRIFYASNKEMFLISSNTISPSEAFGDSIGIPINESDYIKDDEEPSKIVINDEYGAKYNETYNSKWYGYGMTDTNKRSLATAYLCDSKKWTDYVGDTAPDGTYAVGGPTKELFILSWNASIPKTGVQRVSLADEDVTEEGYAYDKPTYLYMDNPVLTTILPDTENSRGLYNTGLPYWLASPSSYDTINLCTVDNYGFVSDWDYLTHCGARPLVSIPMSKVQLKDGKVTIGNN